jgi:hypothetical protein
MDENRAKMVKMDENRAKMVKMDKNGRKRAKWLKNGRKIGQKWIKKIKTSLKISANGKIIKKFKQ